MNPIPRRTALKMIASGGVALATNGAATVSTQTGGPELMIRRGRVVNADSVADADVRILGEQIAEVGPNLVPSPGARVLDATGRLVLPGGIDPHVHVKPDYGVDDLAVASSAALAGGVTTIGTFAGVNKDERILDALQTWSDRVNANAITDVFLHTQSWPPTSELIAVLPDLAVAGQPSIKLFLPESDFGVHVHDVARLVAAARTSGVICMLHCEDASIVAAAQRRLMAEGRGSLASYGASRPAAAEVAATSYAAALCESTGAPIYVVHMSSARALEACQRSRAAGAPLWIETRPLYLHHTADRMEGPDAPLYVGQPPLRDEADRREMWGGLSDGRIDVLGSDHAPFTRAEKMDPKLSVANTLPGMSDVQFMLPMYYSEGVGRRGMALTRFVATTSTTAARIFGLYPRKGVIRAGADADVVIWDPTREGVVSASNDLSNADYSVYEGSRVTGWPVVTIRRGAVVYEAGRVSGRPGSGRLVSREPWKPASKGPI